jgi:hypothetical protein
VWVQEGGKKGCGVLWVCVWREGMAVRNGEGV